jgi:hypothetical protein
VSQKAVKSINLYRGDNVVVVDVFAANHDGIQQVQQVGGNRRSIFGHPKLILKPLNIDDEVSRRDYFVNV